MRWPKSWRVAASSPSRAAISRRRSAFLQELTSAAVMRARDPSLWSSHGTCFQATTTPRLGLQESLCHAPSTPIWDRAPRRCIMAVAMPDPDVLVVGAGPTGLMLGGVLTRLGVSVRLVDREPAPHGHARATGIQPRTLEIFDRLGIVDGWLREGQVLHAFRSLTPEGRELRAERFDHLDTPYPFSLNIQQRITERLLTEDLERHGGRVERGVELIALDQDAEAVTAVLRRGRQEETVRCPYVVGTDGAHSRVRDAIRAPVVGGDYASAFVV